MKYQSIAGTGLEVSKLSFSMWSMLMQPTWRIQDDMALMKTIQAAYEAGINCLETAPIYGFGHGESLLGSAISHLPRNDLILCTRFGLRWDASNQLQVALSPEHIRQDLEYSLIRLETDYIDIYQPYFIPETEPIEEIWGTLAQLQREGKIRYVSAANLDLPQIRQCEEIMPLHFAQLPYSLAFREIQEELLPYCAENGIGIFAYSPMHLSQLLKKLAINRASTRNSLIRAMFTRDSDTASSVDLNFSIAPIAQNRNISPAQLAIAWILHFEGIASVSITAKTVEQIERIQDAADNTLHHEDLIAIGEHIAETIGI